MNHTIIDKVISVEEVAAVMIEVAAADTIEVATADTIEVAVEDAVASIGVDIVDAVVDVVVRPQCPSELPIMPIHTKENIWSVGRVCSNGKFFDFEILL